ncbi:hypothetical protein A2701_03795 [Candidatus Amesbacteria bacterium RIFCSPHIGHO2_01_FULL_47_34]|uniref:Uncharacterized protein n=1 Tax=Candidatus Amesbacteria bacterium RIFCSPLOWO2_01_FULL_47_33 TaxID=1797258 RepID=A0A1F4Z0D3_9BACT|nr:MAG: hypothetical protein A2972_04645 [Candidatus Amesbacteria bacterium RIFCSPLOWO2_01_FULL_47_33]OGD00468.1 MAG: hypothetical protein A2701_03795 [Candidatus Amesbacteria bacterium RIFCSPHIGHO2_01_FULL_47_34]
MAGDPREVLGALNLIRNSRPAESGTGENWKRRVTPSPVLRPLASTRRISLPCKSDNVKINGSMFARLGFFRLMRTTLILSWRGRNVWVNGVSEYTGKYFSPRCWTVSGRRRRARKVRDNSSRSKRIRYSEERIKGSNGFFI